MKLMTQSLYQLLCNLEVISSQWWQQFWKNVNQIKYSMKGEIYLLEDEKSLSNIYRYI